MTTTKLWARLEVSKGYRRQFVSAQAKKAFAFQLRSIMKRRGLSQEQLAVQSGLTQGVISRAADPNYGKLTTTVIVKIANGLDMAYLGVLVPFSVAADWFENLSEDSVQVKTFEEENETLHEESSIHSLSEPTLKREPAFTGTAAAMGHSSRLSDYGGAARMGTYLVNDKKEAA